MDLTTRKQIEAEKNNDKDRKALYKLINNVIYGKTMEKFIKQSQCKTSKQRKGQFKMHTKQSYMSHKIFDNNLVVICKSKLALKLNKPAKIGMYILELKEVLMHKFHYDYIKSKYDNKSKLLFTGTDNLMNEIKTEDVYEDFSSDKEMLHFSNY